MHNEKIIIIRRRRWHVFKAKREKRRGESLQPRAKAELIILRRHASSLICIINGNAGLQPWGPKKELPGR